MKSKPRFQLAKRLILLLFVAILAVLAPFFLLTDSATYAQSETAPTLTVQVGDGVIELRWNDVAGASAYAVHAWWDEDVDWVRIDDGGVKGTSYTHGDPVLGRRYWYSVCVLDADGVQGACSDDPFPSAAVSAPSIATATPTATVVATRTPTPTATQTPTSSSPSGERAALVALYNATDGPNWSRRDNWLTDQPLSTWYGVSTDANGNVTWLFLAVE